MVSAVADCLLQSIIVEEGRDKESAEKMGNMMDEANDFF